MWLVASGQENSEGPFSFQQRNHPNVLLQMRKEHTNVLHLNICHGALWFSPMYQLLKPSEATEIGTG